MCLIYVIKPESVYKYVVHNFRVVLVAANAENQMRLFCHTRQKGASDKV